MPEKIQLDEASRTTSFGRFIVQPLEKGFGVTLGNSMRRVLLSSLPGYAITAFRVEGLIRELAKAAAGKHEPLPTASRRRTFLRSTCNENWGRISPSSDAALATRQTRSLR